MDAKYIKFSVSGGTSYCTEYQAVVDAMTTDPVTYGSSYNSFVVSGKSHGWWDKFDVLYVFCQETNSGGEALLNWKNPTGDDNCTNNSATFTALEGFTGNGSSAYLDTNFNPSTEGVNYTLNDASIYVYVRNDVTATAAAVGCQASGYYAGVWPRNSSNIYACQLNDTGASTAGNTATPGLYGADRTASDNIVLSMNGTAMTTSSISSATIPNANFYIMTRPGSSAYATYQISIVAIGGSLTDTIRSNFNTDCETLMDALGKGVE